MTQNLSYIIEEDSIQCSVCEKYFSVDELTLEDWNFTWDGFVNSDCCSDCASDNLCVENKNE